MFRTLLRSICLLPLLCWCGNVDAQIVRIGGFGGVSVRAPFVAVDVLPYGGTRVRAPFTRVDTGVYRYGTFYRGYYPPYYSYYPAPRVVYGGPVVYEPAPVAVYSPPVTVYEPVSPYPPVAAAPPVVTSEYPLSDVSQLPRRLRAAAARLSHSLSLRRGDADVWLDYLGPNRIVDVIDRGADPASLRQLVANYDGVVSNGSLISIRSASGFSETRSLLKQYVAQGTASVAKPPTPTPAPTRAPAAAPAPATAPAGAKSTARSSGKPTDNGLNPFAEPEGKATKGEDNGPVPPPPADAVPPPPQPAPPRAQAEPTPAEPIKTATGGEVPTPI